MFSAEDIEKAKKVIAELSRLNLRQDSNSKSQKDQSGDRRKAHRKMNNTGSTDSSYNAEGISILPSELLVIAGIICDVLQVNSVLVNRNQEVQIVLTGTLKTSTQLDKVMRQLGHMPFDQVMKCIIDNCNND